MTSKRLRKKRGLVILLDALGASGYSEEKIKKFLSARSELNSGIADLAKTYRCQGPTSMPSIYTFGDTIVITIELRGKKYHDQQIMRACLLMRRYLFHSLEQGILFRGSFSIGTYIEDSESNTVMGEALTDAAQWYEKSDWMGIACTPRTNCEMEYCIKEEFRSNWKFVHPYRVPMKDGTTVELYPISWPGCFHDKGLLRRYKKNDPTNWFLSTFKNFSVPFHATSKFQNTKLYFEHVANELANSSLNTDAPPTGGAPVS